jgi:uncharacterized membrane protein YsdA (DUF1294 family)
MVIGAYLFVNVISMLMFLLDKLSSRKGAGRISEKRLLMMALLGPFGAWTGMRGFRHKTRKPLFLLVPLFVGLHLVLFYLIFL